MTGVQLVMPTPPDKATAERLGQLMREIAAQRSARRDVTSMAPTVPMQVDPRRPR